MQTPSLPGKLEQNSALHDFSNLVRYLAIFCLAVGVGFFLISNSRRLFISLKPSLLRRNLITFLTGVCFFFAIGHLIPDFRNIMENFGWFRGSLLCCVVVIADVLIPYNIVLYITEGDRFSKAGFMKQQVLIFAGIVLSTIVVNGLLNYWINGGTQYLKYSVAWSFYMAGFGSLIYLLIRQYDLEKKKKLFAKELEVAKLNEAKTKAELEALHSKINPHFLYNALNAVADLSIRDGHKARQMSLSLADLFRYSINYSESSFATIGEELEIVKIYLQIEKIRFEERLNYSIEAEEAVLRYQVPRFILQPVVENAVKHGLKNLNTTDIRIHIKKNGDALTIKVFDNGPDFPADIITGYGLKSVFDKLELLFKNRFEVALHNEPAKNFEITLFN